MHFVARIDDLPHRTDPASGLTTVDLVGPDIGSVHMRSRSCLLPRGGRVERHAHPHEQGFVVLDGAPRVELDGRWYQLTDGDYGVVPAGVPHAWAAADGEARWLSVGAPQSGGSVPEVLAAGTLEPPRAAPARPDLASPLTRWLGHFDAALLPPPGDQQQAGYHGSGVAGVSIRMMVDSQLDADHMNVFVVQFAPGGAGEVHDHPYEESYLLLEGEAEAVLEGQRYRVSAGDLVWTSVGASHGFFNHGDGPVRWIETQTPQPPRRGGHRFAAPWERLAEPRST